MEKFICFTGAFRENNFSERFTFQHKDPEKPSGAPGQKPPPKKESFWEEAERKARELNTGATEALAKAGKAIQGTAAEVPGVVRGYGEAVRDAHARAVESTSNAIGSVVEGAKAAGRGVARGHEIAVDKISDALVSIDEKVRGAGRAVWEKARPVVVVLVGEGYLALNQVNRWRQGAVEWTADKLYKTDGYVRFVAQYVKDGVLNKAEIAKKYGQQVADAVDGVYQEAKKDTQEAFAAISRGHEIAMDKISDAMVAIDITVRGAGRVAWEKARPVVVVLVGEGYIAVKQVEQWRQGAVNWTGDKLVQVDGYARFVAQYVEQGVLNKVEIARKYGNEVANAVADYYYGAVDKTSKAIGAVAEGAQAAGRGILRGHEIAVDKISDAIVAIDLGVRGAARETWEKTRPVILVLAGEGYIAVKQLDRWRQGAADWTGDQLYKTDGYVRFVAQYVKDGVLNKVEITKRYGKGIADAVAATYDKAKKRVDEHITVARAEGERILGGEQPAAIARAPKPPAPGRAPAAAPRPVAPEGAGAVARPHAENLPPLVPLVRLGPRSPEAVRAEIIEHIVKKGENMWRILKKYYPANLVNQALCDAIQEKSLGEVARLPGGRKSLIIPGQVIKIPKRFTYRDKRGAEVTVMRNDELKRLGMS